MNIAVIFNDEPRSGGGYQTQLSMLLELKKIKKFNFIPFTFSQENKKLLESLGFRIVLIKEKFFSKAIRHLNKKEWTYYFSPKIKLITVFEKKLNENNIDLVYFLSPSSFSLNLVSHNYIITVWDLCHRDFPEFPEVNYYREFERREQLYTKSLKKAVAVLTDSELGRQNVIRRYGLNSNRVFSVSYAPSINAKKTPFVDIKNKYGINNEYIYYPAQFWPHKNHIYIIDAISMLKKDGINITAVFSGSDKGNLNYVLNYARKIGVDDLIKYIGFAPNEEIYHLYKQSLALVMPTYFGPTNIPPLEAFAIGTPVIYSNLDGLKEQVGDAALLCDLKNPSSLANHLKSLLQDKNKRNELIDKGKIRLKQLQQISDNVLEKIFIDYEFKLKTWKS